MRARWLRRRLVSALLLLSLLACATTGVQERPVFGVDNRKEVIHAGPATCAVGSTVFAIVAKSDLQRGAANTWRVAQRQTLEDAGWCANTRFSAQPVLARCTGFLIAPDTVATAGHCIHEEGVASTLGVSCQNARLILDFKLALTREANTFFPDENVFACAEVLAGTDSRFGPDWRVIRLDRSSDRPRIPVYAGNPLSSSQDLRVVGHPLGLPMKAADDGRVFGYTNGRYRTTLDTFRGNSGSPVYTIVDNQALVVGMMTGGTQDTRHAPTDDCVTEFVCAEGADCRGQLATDSAAFVDYAEHPVESLGSANKRIQVSSCIWCQEAMYSQSWQCPIAATIE